MAATRTAKKRSNRGWWWDHFIEHPGYANKEESSMSSGKAKVICSLIYQQHIARKRALDEQQISAGLRDSPRDDAAIAGTRILTKWRNRLSTQTLTLLAELKMYVHEEHARDNVVKKRLKRQYAEENIPSGPKNVDRVEAIGGSSAGDSNIMTQSFHTEEADQWDCSRHAGASTNEKRGIRGVAAELVRAVDEEEEYSAAETCLAPSDSEFSAIPIRDLLDFSRAEEWLGSFYQTAVRGLDAKLELYQLLDLDAEGIDDPDLPQADDILNE